MLKIIIFQSANIRLLLLLIAPRGGAGLGEQFTAVVLGEEVDPGELKHGRCHKREAGPHEAVQSRRVGDLQQVTTVLDADESHREDGRHSFGQYIARDVGYISFY